MRIAAALAATLRALLAGAAPAVAAAALAGAAPAPQEAPGDELRAELTVEAKTLQPGAPIRMVLRATAPAGSSIRLPALDRTLGPFEVRDVRRSENGAGAAALEATLVAWDAGELEIPGMKVEATLPDGSVRTAAVPARKVALASLVGDDLPVTELPAEIRGPVEVATRGWGRLAAVAATAVALLALVRWLVRRGRRAAPEPELPPADRARLELDRLDAESLPARGEVEAFFVRLSGIVRAYLEGRFSIAAPDRTTQEFLREAAHHPDLAGERERELGAFLRAADMVKFAAARPPADACAGAMRAMRAFVEATAPREADGATDADGGPAAGRAPAGGGAGDRA